MNLWQDFKTNSGKRIHKWAHYFPVYEKHLSSWRNRTLTFLEIGVSHGGGLEMWQRFLGPMATVVGIDIVAGCKRHEQEGIHVRIGDQSDTGFLQSVIDEFGVPDIVLDDGSHQMRHIRESFEFLYPRMPKNGVYLVEDLHTAYWKEYGGALDSPDSFITISKRFIDSLNAEHSRGAVEADFHTRHTFGISFYDSMIVFERGTIPKRVAIKTGSNPPA